MKSLESPRAAPGHHLEDELLRRIAEKLALLGSLLDGTAGRDLLDELKRLRYIVDGYARFCAKIGATISTDQLIATLKESSQRV